MRWSRAHAKGPLYFTSTAVVMSELAKIAVSFVLLLVQSGSLPAFSRTVPPAARRPLPRGRAGARYWAWAETGIANACE